MVRRASMIQRFEGVGDFMLSLNELDGSRLRRRVHGVSKGARRLQAELRKLGYSRL